MDPVSITAISMAASAGGGGLGAVSSIMQGNAKSAEYGYKASIAMYNQKLALQNADYATMAGEQEAQHIGMKTRYQMGETRAQQGAGGLDVNSGSNVAVRESEHEIGQYDEAIARSNAAKRAYGYKVEAAGYGAEVAMNQSAAKQAKTAGYIGAVSSILGSATSVASKWVQAKSSGIYDMADSSGGAADYGGGGRA